MAALATQEQVETILGRALTAAEQTRLDGMVAAASARFSAAAGGRTFEAASTTSILRVVDGAVQLPQRPVTSVDTVKTVNADGTVGVTISTWVFDGIWTIRLDDWWVSQINAPAVAVDDWIDTVEVTYSHGYATIPDDVAYCVAAMVSRAFGSSAAGSGVESETIGGYSYRLGAAAASGALGMTPDEAAIAKRYRRPNIRTVALS